MSRNISLHDLLIFDRRRRVPVVLQAEKAECGLACIAMVAGFFGHEIDLWSLRARFSVSARGCDMSEMIEIAGRLGLSGRALRLEPDALSELKAPCILHWDMNHFVVLTSVRGRHVTIHDPARGARQLPLGEVGKYFTGVALELTPTGQFAPQVERRKLNMPDLWGRIVGLRRSFGNVLILALLLQFLAIASPFYLQLAVDEVVVREDRSLLLILAVAFSLLLLLEIGVFALRESIVLRVATALNVQMAAKLFRHLIRLPMSYFYRRHVGDVTSRVSSLTSIRDVIASGIVSVAIDGIMALITLVVMFAYSAKLAFVVVAFTALYVMGRIIGYFPLKERMQENVAARARTDSHLIETVRAMEAIKLLQLENRRHAQWQNYLATALNSMIGISRLNIRFAVLNRGLFGFENIFVVFLGIRAIIDGSFSIGMLFAFMSYRSRFTTSIDGLMQQSLALRALDVHLDRLADITFSEPEAVDAHEHVPPASKAERVTEMPERQRLVITGKIEVRQLAFAYSERDPVFADVTFAIEAGEAVALCGPSGCGKTTLMKCLMGLLSPTSGEILIDGKHLANIASYRSQIAAVLQDDQLLAGTIGENIASFDPKIDMKRVRRCASHAGILSDIEAMPMQYNTLVGDMGSTLSGGQKQRVILARALYRMPRILFLDEATSHLDLGKEEFVTQQLRELCITRIIVSHRTETIRMADRVVYLGKEFGAVAATTQQ